jgi:hypothetical protein
VSDPLDDLRQVAAEEQAERDELARVIDVDGAPVDREAALRELHAEADEDNPVVWRRPS